MPFTKYNLNLSLYLPISKWHLLDMGEYYHKNTRLFDPDMRGSASNVCISLESKLHYLTLERTMGRVTGCFLRGCMPTCVVWKRRRGGQTVGCCCCIWMCDMKSLLRVLHCLISFRAKQHHNLFASPSLHFLRDTWYSWYEYLCTWHPCLCANCEVCACVCVFDTRRIIPFVLLNDLNWSLPPGSASMCISKTFAKKLSGDN